MCTIEYRMRQSVSSASYYAVLTMMRAAKDVLRHVPVIPSAPSRPARTTLHTYEVPYNQHRRRLQPLDAIPFVVIPLDVNTYRHQHRVNVLPYDTHRMPRDPSPSKIPAGRDDSSLLCNFLVDVSGE